MNQQAGVDIVNTRQEWCHDVYQRAEAMKQRQMFRRKEQHN